LGALLQDCGFLKIQAFTKTALIYFALFQYLALSQKLGALPKSKPKSKKLALFQNLCNIHTRHNYDGISLHGHTMYCICWWLLLKMA
jgi:hypothetical protein